MFELITTFTPADGSAPRIITLRISDVRPDSDGATWSVAVDVLGFKHGNSVRLKQVDWAHAIMDAAQFVVNMVALIRLGPPRSCRKLRGHLHDLLGRPRRRRAHHPSIEIGRASCRERVFLRV